LRAAAFAEWIPTCACGCAAGSRTSSVVGCPGRRLAAASRFAQPRACAGGPVGFGRAKLREDAEHPPLEPERDAPAVRGRAIGQACGEACAEEVVMMIERRRGDRVPGGIDGELQLVLERAGLLHQTSAFIS